MLKKIIFALSLGSILLLPLPTLAANLKDAAGNLTPAAQTAGYQEKDIGNITGQIINTALQLVGIIFLGLMVYAGYLWMTARGDESQIEKAQKIITSAIIGLVLTMSAYAITTLVTKKFGGGNTNPTQDTVPKNEGPEMVDSLCNRCIDDCAGQGQACMTACNNGPCRNPDPFN